MNGNVERSETLVIALARVMRGHAVLMVVADNETRKKLFTRAERILLKNEVVPVIDRAGNKISVPPYGTFMVLSVSHLLRIHGMQFQVAYVDENAERLLRDEDREAIISRICRKSVDKISSPW